MYDDVIALRDFYKTPLGQHVAGQMQSHLAQFWHVDASYCNVMVGYGIGWLQSASRDYNMPANLFTLMPARLGVISWPESGPGCSSLVDNHALPLPDVYIDRLLLAHALEFDVDPGRLLDECWRVLDGAGKLLVVVPNRRGLWARLEHVPFGHGRPYSSRQLCQLLKTHGFVPKRTYRAVCLPPLHNRAMMRFATTIERLGQRWWPALGGVLLVEAEKKLYAAAGNTSKLRRRRTGTAPSLATLRVARQRDVRR